MANPAIPTASIDKSSKVHAWTNSVPIEDPRFKKKTPIGMGAGAQSTLTSMETASKDSISKELLGILDDAKGKSKDVSVQAAGEDQKEAWKAPGDISSKSEKYSSDNPVDDSELTLEDA